VRDLVQSGLGRVQLRAELGALESDGRALRVVLVVGVGGLRCGNQVSQGSLERGDMSQPTYAFVAQDRRYAFCNDAGRRAALVRP